MVEPEVTPVTQTEQDKSHRRPRQTICTQCEDKNSPVFEDVDGFSFHYEIIKGVTIEIFLHDDCACKWYDAFSAHAPMMEEIRKSAAQAA